jgi:hypothetical protein
MRAPVQFISLCSPIASQLVWPRLVLTRPPSSFFRVTSLISLLLPRREDSKWAKERPRKTSKTLSMVTRMISQASSRAWWIATPLLTSYPYYPHSIEYSTYRMQQLLRDLLPRRPFSRHRSGHAYRAFADCLSERVYALGLFCIRCLLAVPLLPGSMK